MYIYIYIYMLQMDDIAKKEKNEMLYQDYLYLVYMYVLALQVQAGHTV